MLDSIRSRMERGQRRKTSNSMRSRFMLQLPSDFFGAVPRRAPDLCSADERSSVINIARPPTRFAKRPRHSAECERMPTGRAGSIYSATPVADFVLGIGSLPISGLQTEAPDRRRAGKKPTLSKETLDNQISKLQSWQREVSYTCKLNGGGGRCLGGVRRGLSS